MWTTNSCFYRSGTKSLGSILWKLWKILAAHIYSNDGCPDPISTYYVRLFWSKRILLHSAPHTTPYMFLDLCIYLQTKIPSVFPEHSTGGCSPWGEGSSKHGTHLSIFYPALIGFWQARWWSIWRRNVSNFAARLFCVTNILVIFQGLEALCRVSKCKILHIHILEISEVRNMWCLC